MHAEAPIPALAAAEALLHEGAPIRSGRIYGLGAEPEGRTGRLNPPHAGGYSQNRHKLPFALPLETSCRRNREFCK